MLFLTAVSATVDYHRRSRNDKVRHKEHQREGEPLNSSGSLPLILILETQVPVWTPGGPFLATVKSQVDCGQLVLVQKESC